MSMTTPRVTVPVEPTERLAQYVKGVSPYRAWRGAPPEGEPTLKSDISAMLSAALSTREEAPAEAGEVRRAIKCLTFELDRVHPNHKTMFVHVADLRVALSALRAQPQAREDAQPVACPHCRGPARVMTCMGEYVGKGRGVEGGYYGPERWTVVCNSLYEEPGRDCPSRNVSETREEAIAKWNDTHPAPDALRGAVEKIRAEINAPLSGPTHGAWDRGRIAGLKEALAALQAEQKGGA